LFSDFSGSSKDKQKEQAMRTTRRLPLLGLALGGLMAAMALADSAALAQTFSDLPVDTLGNRRLRQLDLAEQDLRAARDTLDLCREVACATPSEAAALAFEAGPDQPLRGRFILDVRSATGPGNRFQPPGLDLFYLGSEFDLRRYGAIVLAIEPAALEGLLNRDIAAGEARVRPTSGRMRSKFSGQRVIVDGEARLQWVEFPDWQTFQRNGTGYHQVWVRVTSPDQIRLVED
jgi:hypothetical protein